MYLLSSNTLPSVSDARITLGRPGQTTNNSRDRLRIPLSAIELTGRRQYVPRQWFALISSALSLLLRLALSLALGFCAAPATAQHTTVEKNGLAGTIETDYDAAGKATEMRTIGTDGKLQQKVQYQHLPGYYVPDQTDTTYWPNGQMRKVVRKTYDESANFTGEFIQIYDEAGQQIAGHKLTHDPRRGTYRCSEWNTSGQDYRGVECPSGEEESGGNREPKKFTYDEVMEHLDAARKDAMVSPVAAPTGGLSRDIGIILPAQVRPGERVSGLVIENADHYAEIPEVTITRVTVPFESSGEGSRLSGWLFEAAGEEPRRADGPITFVVPRTGSELNITFRETGNPAHAFSQVLAVRSQSNKNSPPPNSFQVAGLCMKDGLCAVSGPFSGDSSKTFAAFENRTATIVAETSDTAYLRVPEATGPGSRPLFLAEGLKVVALPAVIGTFFVRNNGRELQAAETLITFPTLDGPGDIPESAWQAGNFPAGNLERARRLIPGFELTGNLCGSRDDKEAEGKSEAEEKDRGEKDKKEEKQEEGKILMVIKNLAPDRTSLHGSKNDLVAFCLSDEAFERGAFKYDLRIDSQKAGKADVKGYVIPFLGTVAGQEFIVKTEPK